MAKKRIEAAEIVITTTDGGSMKITGQEAKKLAKQMKGLGGASQSTDRRIKGVTQQSSNASKNFSKQAQTMQGGIVAVYAQIAANVFAVSAAFQFLKSSFETRNLIEGQKAFGSITGVAYKTLTSDLQDATAGMLQFKEAASAVAIGTASGLSGGQITKLGEAAKNASMALGRDLTDSFNRLIRGVTKAEPELLDELGIVLRLENATRDYAAAVGKAREDLNAYERTQAVLNDVLTQAETKFGRITELMDPDAFALGQLQKEIDDLVMGFQELLVGGLLPVIGFFKENALALVAAIGLFVAPIIKGMFGDLDEAAENAKNNFKKHADDMKEVGRDSGQEIRSAFAGARKIDPSQNLESMEALDKMGVKGKGPEIKDDKGKKTGYKQLNKRQIAAYRRAIKEKKGIYQKFNLQEKRAFRQHLATQEALLNKSSKVQVSIVKRTQMLKDGIVKAGTAVVAGVEAAKVGIVRAGAVAMNAAMTAAGVIGVFAMILSLGWQVIKWFMNLDKAAAAARAETEKFTGAQKELGDELRRMTSVRDQGLLGLADGVEQTGNALQSYDIKNKLGQINKEMDKFHGAAEDWKDTDFAEEAFRTARELERIEPRMKGYADAIRNMDEDALKVHENTWLEIANEIINAAQALKRFSENQKAIGKQIDSLTKKMNKMPFQDLIAPLTASVNDFDEAMVEVTNRVGQLKKDMEMKASGTQFQDVVSTQIINQYSTHGPTSMTTRDKSAAQANARTLLDEMKKRGGDTSTISGRQNIFAGINWAKGGGMGDWDADEISSEQDLFDAITERFMEDKSGGGEGSNLQAIQDMFGEKAAGAAKTAWVKATKEQRGMIQQNARNKLLLDSMLKTQEAALGFAEKETAAKKKLADAGIGTTADLKKLKNKAKVDQQIAKQNKADLAHQTAMNVKQMEELKLLQQAQTFLTEAEGSQLSQADIQDMSLEEIKEHVKTTMPKQVTQLEAQLKTQTGVLDNSVKAVENSKGELDLETQITTNKQAQKVLDDLAVDRAERLKQLTWDRLMMENAIAGRKRDRETGGGTGVAQFGWAAKRTEWADKQTDLTARIGTNNTAISNAQSNLSDQAGFKEGTDFTGSVESIRAAYGGTNVDEIETMLKTLNTERQKGKDLSAEQLKLDKAGVNFINESLGVQLEKTKWQSNQVLALNPAEALFQQNSLKYLDQFGQLSTENAKIVADMSVKQASVNIELELSKGVASTLQNGFVSMFQSLIDGSKSFKDSMKDLAKSVLADLAAMYLKAAALKFMLAFMPGGNAVMETLKGTRYGGIRSRSFAGGGVASGPESGYAAMLHGTEAVVPLGNDRAIPVDLRGGGGNTVNVSISMQGGQSQTSTAGGGSDMQALGRSIGGLVQQHLQTEMRPGGLLNRQGASGRQGGGG